MEDKKIIIEELNRIKNLMGYNRSKTLNENINEGWFDTLYDTVDGEIARYLLPSGDIINGDKIKGMVPKGSEQLNVKNATDAVSAVGTVSSLTGGGGAASTVVSAAGKTAAASTFLGLGPVGWTVLGVAGIAALGMWGMTKDDDMGMITRLFDMCKTSPDRKKWKRFLTDDEGLIDLAVKGTKPKVEMTDELNTEDMTVQIKEIMDRFSDDGVDRGGITVRELTGEEFSLLESESKVVIPLTDNGEQREYSECGEEERKEGTSDTGREDIQDYQPEQSEVVHWVNNITPGETIHTTSPCEEELGEEEQVREEVSKL